MDEYQTSTSTRWTRCSRRSQSVIRQAASVSIGCKISRDAALPWWTKEYAVIRSETGGRMGYALKIGIRLGTLCDAAQAEEQEMADSSRLCSHGMPTRLPHWEEGAWMGSLAGSKAAARHAIGSMPANSAWQHQSRGWNGSNRVGGNTQP
jgi:hypothetical protein